MDETTPKCPPVTREEIETNLNKDFDDWFARLQALTPATKHVQEDWAERWFDGYTPEEALEDGPED